MTELTWHMIIRGTGAVTGYQAEGARWHYLTGRKDGGSGFWLARWARGELAHLDDIMQACRSAADVSTPDEGRRLAQQFEDGADIAGIGWFHGDRPPGLVTS